MVSLNHFVHSDRIRDNNIAYLIVHTRIIFAYLCNLFIFEGRYFFRRLSIIDYTCVCYASENSVTVYRWNNNHNNDSRKWMKDRKSVYLWILAFFRIIRRSLDVTLSVSHEEIIFMNLVHEILFCEKAVHY